MSLLHVSMAQALSVWSDLEAAYYGQSSYAGSTAEIYAYRLSPYDGADLASPELRERMLVPQGYDAADSSDGIPVSSDDADSQVTPQSHDEHSVPEEVVVSEPTVRLPTLTLSETFTVLWLVQCAARSVGVDVEAEPMPYNAPTGVHLWSPDHKALCRWLQRERKRHFASIAIEQTIEVHKIEAARFLLRSLADGLPMAKVIEVGPRRFVHLAFRSGEE